ncbi:MAG: hypothetical protein KDC24_04890 [Saprospiraceae bacterium]|nr:hypothetical protein [Saprospiraceae bacterium]
MKKLQLLLSFLFISLLSLSAQNKKFGADLSEVKTYKNQLELDIKNIFSGLGNATLLYKRGHKLDKFEVDGKLRFVRVLARFNNQIALEKNPFMGAIDSLQIEFHPNDVFDLSIGIGFEQQKMFRNFVHYWSIDCIANYYSIDGSAYSIGGIRNVRTGVDTRYTSTIQAGVNPFFGIKYYLSEKFSIGIETGFAFQYFHQKITEVDYTTTYSNGTYYYKLMEKEPSSTNGITTNFNNLRFLNLGYTF